VHPGGGKKYRGIIFGYQGFTLDLGMFFQFEKFDVFGTKFLGIHRSLHKTLN
jgi:hypothetical protein